MEADLGKIIELAAENVKLKARVEELEAENAQLRKEFEVVAAVYHGNCEHVLDCPDSRLCQWCRDLLKGAMSTEKEAREALEKKGGE